MARRSDHSREELFELALTAARQLAEDDGLRGVTARGVARKIGYTIGTIYNVFDDLDDLIVQLNTRTLDEMYASLSSLKPGSGTEKYLYALARRYMEFTQQHPRLWGLLFEHRLPEGRTLPETYYERVFRLYELIEIAIEPYFGARQQRKKRHMARVLWSSVYGICLLGMLDKIATEESPPEMVKTLVKMFVLGIRAETRS